MFVALLIVSMLIGYAVYLRLVKNDARQTEEALAHIADIQETAVSNWVLERYADASVFSSGQFLEETIHEWIRRGAPDDATRRQVHEQLQTIKTVYNYLDVLIVDTDGKIRITTGSNDAKLDPVPLQTTRDAIANNRTQISSIYSAKVYAHKKQVVDIAVPLVDARVEQTKTPSILLLRASADTHLKPFAHSMQSLNRATEILLAEIRNQKVVAISTGSNTDYFSDGDILPLSPADLEKNAQRPIHAFPLRSRSDVTTTSVARKIEGVPWYLIAMEDQRASRATLHRIAWIITGISAAILSVFGSALLMWWKKRESEFRLQELRSATEKEMLQRKYDYLSQYATDMIILTDTSGRIIDANDKTLRMLTRDQRDLAGVQIDTLFLRECQPALNEAFNKLQRQDVAVFEVAHQNIDGSTLQVEVSARAIQLDSKRIVQLICRDITERRQSEAALQESKERLNGILASILDAVWSFSADLTRLNYVNQSVEKIYGYPVSAFFDNPRVWLDAVLPEDREQVWNTLATLTAEQPVCDSEHRIIRPDGSMRWVHCRGRLVLDEHGQPLRVDGVTTDITERKNAEQQVQTLAYYDSVTMLPNRALLHDRLAQAMHMASRSEKKVALLFMDLDNFKHINDSLGHHFGDMLLRTIGERLLQCVRDEDTVARIGGDEFLVVLPDIDKGTQAVSVAEKILLSIARPFLLQEQQIHATISIGISIYPDDAQDPHTLIRHADSALYQAKGHGRDNYQFFTPELNHQITRSSHIERQLRRAIDNGNLRLWYQPQVDTRDGHLIGAEALLRWRHDGRDFLSPVEFIPVAEERGMIARIGEWAMREACRQCRQWQLQGLQAVPIAVNVSPLQFQQKGFATMVTGILDEAQLDAAYLELEITESAIMRRAPQVAELARQLREIGVGISIDDFGTGYSNLSYLKQIPIDKIKIDRSFVADMLTDVDDDAITYAIVNLAHSLNLRVIAEGVETHAQVERLRLFGCNEVQGHHYSPAIPAIEFESFLTDRRVQVKEEVARQAL